MRPSIHNVRNTVSELRAALLTPSLEGLESRVPALEAAVRDLEALREVPGVTPRREAESLALDLFGVARLIEHALAFHQGWARLLAAAASNYQPNGEPASAVLAGQISVEG